MNALQYTVLTMKVEELDKVALNSTIFSYQG